MDSFSRGLPFAPIIVFRWQTPDTVGDPTRWRTPLRQGGHAMMEQERRLNSPDSASILIADEERLSREALGSVLWQRGHEVFVAEDGLSALAILEQERPRLVILSLRLLGTLGRALLSELKARRPNCGFIVLCPDYNQDDTVVNAVLECGVL